MKSDRDTVFMKGSTRPGLIVSIAIAGALTVWLRGWRR